MTAQRIQPTEPAAHRKGQGAVISGRAERTAGFEEVLRSRTTQASPVRFSAHALQRMETGGVSLTGEALARLERAVSAADEKGSRDALVLMDDLALVVSISNRTVVTTVGQARRQNGVFTNIDSVVMA